MRQAIRKKGSCKSVYILTTGPRSMKTKRVGTGTSVKSPKMTGWTSLMNAETGFSRQSTSPTNTFEASAPGGIFFKNDVLPYSDGRKNKKNVVHHFTHTGTIETSISHQNTLWTSPLPMSFSLVLRSIEAALGLAAILAWLWDAVPDETANVRVNQKPEKNDM